MLNQKPVTFRLKNTNVPMTYKPDAIGAFAFCRTYTRPVFENGVFKRNESFQDVFERVVNGQFSMLKDALAESGAAFDEDYWQEYATETLADYMNFKVTPPGRGLWACGTTAPVLALVNCSFFSSSYMAAGDPGSYFATAMEALMCGIGLGFDDAGAGRIPLVRPRSPLDSMVPECSTRNGQILYGELEARLMPTRIFTIADTRRGWCMAIRELINSYTLDENGDRRDIVAFNYNAIREKGKPLKTFGGKASGPGPLFELIASARYVLDKNLDEGKTVFDGKLIFDLCNMVGKAVVAGNVRRSSEIGLSADMAACDYKKWCPENEYRMGWSWSSNNSLVIRDMPDVDYEALIRQIVAKIGETGEPGLFYLDNARKYGRLADGETWIDREAMGTNPCGEITLWAAEVCDIAEVYLPNFDTMDIEAISRSLDRVVMYCLLVSKQRTGWKEVDEIKERNNRIGVGLTGIVDFINKWGLSMDDLATFLDKLYAETAKHVDKWSMLLNMNRSIKITTVKPSGTLSLLAGCSSGMHWPHSEYYMRTVRYNKEDRHFTKLFLERGYKVEDDVMNPTTTNVVYFPCHSKNCGYENKHNITVDRQFDLATVLQRHWSDNQVSCTISFDDTEPLVTNLIKHKNALKGISFLRNGNTVYPQMPYTAISRDEYLVEIAKVQPISYSDFAMSAQLVKDEPDKFCSGDACVL